MAQLTAWLVPIPDDLGLNPAIGNKYLLLIRGKDEIKKEAANGPFKQS